MESPQTVRSQAASPDQDVVADSIVASWNPANEDSYQQQGQLPPQRQQQPLQKGQEKESHNKASQSTSLNNQAQPRRVCVACRRRKVGCDKRQPCQHCSKSGTECVYPPDKNMTERLFRDTEILEQLYRLGPMFKTLADRMEQGSLLPPSSSSAASGLPANSLPQNSLPGPRNDQTSPLPNTPPRSVGSASSGSVQDQHLINESRVELQQQPLPPMPLDHDTAWPAAGPEYVATVPSASSSSGDHAQNAAVWTAYGTSMGKLVKDDGRQRYVSGTFWEALHTENDVDEAVMIDDESDFEDTPQSAGPDSSQYALIFNSCVQGNDLSSLHPPLQHRLRTWQLFTTNVHPVATTLHIPSISPMVLKAMQDPRHLAQPLEALLFVIYFGAINSLSADQCHLQFGFQQATALAKFRRGADYALARAKLMQTDDMLTLQVFVAYLVLLRSYDPTTSWNLTGLAARLAKGLGMHRDGSTLNLSPFDAEMRRRLWWSICILDTPASEDHSCSPELMELSSFNSAPPLNFNDEDLHPDMAEYPSESKKMTNMSFTVARCWASNIWRTIIDTRRVDPTTGTSFMSMTMAEKEQWIEQQRQNITSRLSLDSASAQNPLHCLTNTFVKTIISNLRIMILNPLEPGTTLNEEQRRRVLGLAIECMKHSYHLRTDPLVANFSWLTKCYHEWHAFAIILSELCDRPLDKDADEAWRVVEQNAVLRWDSSRRHRRMHQWRSVMRSIGNARRRRKKEVGRRKSALSSQGSSISRRPSALVQPSWPVLSSQQSNLRQASLSESPESSNREVHPSMYPTDEMMETLMGDYTGDDDRLFFD